MLYIIHKVQINFLILMLDNIKILEIELYVMVHKITGIPHHHVKLHVTNISILLYKMEMDKVVGVVVKTNYLM